MPELPCPVGDYTARGSTVKDAAWALSQHLISQHCDSPGDDASMMEQSGSLAGDISLQDIDAKIGVEGRVEIDPGVQRGPQR